MAGLKRRLERIEEAGLSAHWSYEEWPLEDQIAAVLDVVRSYIRFHSDDDIQFPATDRELHLVGILCARGELGEDGGEYTFPTGLTVRLIPDGEGFLIDAPRQIGIEDLPDWMHEHVRRMDPKDQPRREAESFANRKELKRLRELAHAREAWHDEHGWNKGTPEHLIP